MPKLNWVRVNARKNSGNSEDIEIQVELVTGEKLESSITTENTTQDQLREIERLLANLRRIKW